MFDSEPFGQRAVRLGFATSEQVREALETQKLLSEKGGLLGEILVEMGWLSADRYIEVVQALMEDSVEGTRAEIQETFISRVLAKGYVTAENVDCARKIQAGWSRKGKLIGQVMVEMGILRAAQLEDILSSYRKDDQGR